MYCAVCRVSYEWKQPKMVQNDFRFLYQTQYPCHTHTSRAYWGYTISRHHPAARTNECLTSYLAHSVSFSGRRSLLCVCVCVRVSVAAFSIPMARVLAPRPVFMITYFIWLLHRTQTIDLSCLENKLRHKRHHGRHRTIIHSNGRRAHKKKVRYAII